MFSFYDLFGGDGNYDYGASLEKQVATTNLISDRDNYERRAAGDSYLLGAPEKIPFFTDAQVNVLADKKINPFPQECGAFDFACKIGKATDSLGRGLAKGLFIAGAIGVGYIAFKIATR